MIRVMAKTSEDKLVQNIEVEALQTEGLAWYWVDICEPSKEESAILRDFFQFHPLAIEDCLERKQRPKLDVYDDYWFFILNQMNEESYEPEEVNLFLGENYLVSFHKRQVREIDQVWTEVEKKVDTYQPRTILHKIADCLVDKYFPPLYEIEDRLNDLSGEKSYQVLKQSMNELYELRRQLATLRKTIVPMRDLFYRILYTESDTLAGEAKHYLKDVYDHLIQLDFILERNRELSADIRDNYFSLSNDYLNSIMKTLTVWSMFFLPLTFIVGVYGMNFRNMPEIEWRFGYLFSWIIMIAITVGMYMYFKKRDWF